MYCTFLETLLKAVMFRKIVLIMYEKYTNKARLIDGNNASSSRSYFDHQRKIKTRY